MGFTSGLAHQADSLRIEGELLHQAAVRFERVTADQIQAIVETLVKLNPYLLTIF